ncbi:MAG TPA: glutaminase A [Pseudomonadales bacterium]|nr:glutaminase A [Pseudomonadales bacterium]
MRTTISRTWVFSTVVLAISLFAFTGCSQVQTTTQTPETPVAAPVPTDASELSPADLQAAVDEAYAKYKDDHSGKNADYIPYLAGVDSNLFAVVIVTTDGHVYSAGDTNYLFSIQSCSKVFTMSQVMEESGPDAVLKKIGVEPTGMPFNSIVALGYYGNKAVNPLVNAGAIAAVSMVKADNAQDRWNKILAYQSKFAGEPLHLIDEVYKSESDTNFRNRGIAWILYNNGNLFCDPPEATDVYTKECSIGVSARELGIMGATLADRGINPITKERCIESKYVPRVLAVMMMAGFYDESGEWAFRAGLPAKTGVGGGIVAIVPEKMAIVAFAPPLDTAGNSIRATEAIDYIVDKLDVDIFGSLK